MSAVFPSLPARPVLQPAAPRSLPLIQPSLLLRLVLVAGLFVVIAAAAGLANSSAYSVAEPELGLLLRGMALIKAGMALVALALTHWRFGQPVSSAAALGYLLGVWALVGATVLIWYLSFIPAAAALFHLGLFGLLVVASREDRHAPRKPPV
jgi:hypothetical protein